jgi:hypothetical protein
VPRLATVSKFLRMKRDGKLTAIMLLLGQTVYDSWGNISCSPIRFSSARWRSTNSFHKALHHSRLHIRHFCLVSFSASAGRDKWLSRSSLLTPTLPPIYQNPSATYTSYCEQKCACLLPAIFHFPIIPLVYQVSSGWQHSSLAPTFNTIPPLPISSSDNPPKC